MAKTKIFKLALSEDDIAKIEAIQQILPGQPYKSDVIRAAIDKMYSFCVAGKPIGVKESIFVVCGEDTDQATFEPVVAAYEKMTEYLKWENKGHIVVPGVNDPGEVNTKHPEAIEGMKKIGTYY